MSLINVAFFLNLFNLYLKFVFLRPPRQPLFNVLPAINHYNFVVENYSMNEVELTNILPHMKATIRHNLFQNAYTAIRDAIITLRFINADLHIQNIIPNSLLQFEKRLTFYRNNINVPHIVTNQDATHHLNNGHANGGEVQNYFTQNVRHYGYGANFYVYKIKWQHRRNRENVEYIEEFYYNQGVKFINFRQSIRYEYNAGHTLTIQQHRVQPYSIP
ncbi:hypothetical protein ACQ4LE_005384 [Meloidogyne hapla]